MGVCCAVALIAELLMSCDREPPLSPEDARLIAQTESLLRSKLKSPDTARFKKVFVSHSGGVIEVCGQVDALNAFGAYTGYQRFIMGDAVNLLESDYGPEKMDQEWGRYCAR